VRELEHLVERFAVLHDRAWIELADLPERIRSESQRADSLADRSLQGTYHQAKSAFERRYLEETLRLARGNMAAAARIAALDRSRYFRLVRTYGLDPRRCTLRSGRVQKKGAPTHAARRSSSSKSFTPVPAASQKASRPPSASRDKASVEPASGTPK
jgi:hypothetical protein